MAERDVLAEVLRLSTGDVRLFRNAVGAVQDPRSGIWIRYGVCNPGGSDLLGFRSVTITPEMVGSKLAVFCALECKSDTGRVRPEQKLFIDAVNKAGGLAGIVREVDDAISILRWHDRHE